MCALAVSCHTISFVFTTLSPSFTRHFHCRIKRFIGRPCCRHNSTLCWSNTINHGSKCTVTYSHPRLYCHTKDNPRERTHILSGLEYKNFIATWFPSGTLHYTTTELFLLFHTLMHSHALNSGNSYTTFPSSPSATLPLLLLWLLPIPRSSSFMSWVYFPDYIRSLHAECMSLKDILKAVLVCRKRGQQTLERLNAWMSATYSQSVNPFTRQRMGKSKWKRG